MSFSMGQPSSDALCPIPLPAGEELGQTNYFAAVPAGFNKDEWHRLTVRTIADVGDGHVGFVIYLDGDVNKTLEYSTDVPSTDEVSKLLRSSSFRLMQ